MKENLVEVLYRTDRIGYAVNPENLDISPDMEVITRISRGEDIAKVISCFVDETEIEISRQKKDIAKIDRIATETDQQQLKMVRKKEREAEETFLKLLKKYPFEMKLLEAIYQIDGNKLTFFFSAEGRIDFRDFVRELAAEFRTRIELHQSSGREDARRYGGLGICGKTYCCLTWIKKFNQITIQMAKQQNLLSNLSKISGPCGRLLCCLHYEEEFYEKKRAEFPPIKEMIMIEDKNFRVDHNDYFNDTVYLKSDDNTRRKLSLEEYYSIKYKKLNFRKKPPKNFRRNN